MNGTTIKHICCYMLIAGALSACSTCRTVSPVTTNGEAGQQLMEKKVWKVALTLPMLPISFALSAENEHSVEAIKNNNNKLEK